MRHLAFPYLPIFSEAVQQHNRGTLTEDPVAYFGGLVCDCFYQGEQELLSSQAFTRASIDQQQYQRYQSLVHLLWQKEPGQ